MFIIDLNSISIPIGKLQLLLSIGVPIGTLLQNL